MNQSTDKENSLIDLKSELREFNIKLNQKYGATLNALNLKLEYSLKSTLSGHDQVTEMFAKEFNVPPEVTIQIFSYLSIPNLHKYLGASLEQLCVYVRKIGNENFKSQLMEIAGYKIKDDGSIEPFYEIVIFVNFSGAKIISLILTIGSSVNRFICN